MQIIMYQIIRLVVRLLLCFWWITDNLTQVRWVRCWLIALTRTLYQLCYDEPLPVNNELYVNWPDYQIGFNCIWHFYQSWLAPRVAGLNRRLTLRVPLADLEIITLLDHLFWPLPPWLRLKLLLFVSYCFVMSIDSRLVIWVHFLNVDVVMGLIYPFSWYVFWVWLRMP